MDRLARSLTVATLLPGVAFHRRLERLPPARELIEAGAAVALATGFSPDECPSLSLPAILSLACRQMGLTSAEALTAATINAAHALRCAGRLGSLEYGKDADLIMLNVGDYRELTYQFGVNLVAMVMKRGQVLFPRMEF
jgi:imidazolonepropionase